MGNDRKTKEEETRQKLRNTWSLTLKLYRLKGNLGKNVLPKSVELIYVDNQQRIRQFAKH